MTSQGDMPQERLTMMPDSITIEHYGNPDVMDMMIWRHVNEQRDAIVVRAWKRGQKKSTIAEVMGIGRTSVWRIIERYLGNGGD